VGTLQSRAYKLTATANCFIAALLAANFEKVIGDLTCIRTSLSRLQTEETPDSVGRVRVPRQMSESASRIRHAEVGRSHRARAGCALEKLSSWPFPHLQTCAAFLSLSQRADSQSITAPSVSWELRRCNGLLSSRMMVMSCQHSPHVTSPNQVIVFVP
jgi:hypothetical protein